MTTPYPNLLFDLDGTLTDPKEGIVKSLRYATAKLGLPDLPEAEIVRFIGPPLQEIFSELLGADKDDRIQEGIELYRERFSVKGLFENQKYEGIDAVLAELTSAERRLWVVTSKPRVYADQIIRHFGLSPFFQDVYGPELDGTLRDKAELIAHVLQSEKIPKNDVLMIGDRFYDVIGATANGVKAVGVLWGYGSEAELVKAGAWKICRNVENLTKTVDS